jgi:hypothetical protein
VIDIDVANLKAVECKDTLKVYRNDYNVVYQISLEKYIAFKIRDVHADITDQFGTPITL